jgi:phage replication O-like protein O
MANPQLENGYTSTANELIEAECRACLSGNEWRVYTAVKRLTYGWHKKEDRIAYSQIATLTGLGRNRVYEAVKSLTNKKVLLSRYTGTHSPQILSINKDFKRWKVSRSGGTSRKTGTPCPSPAVQDYPATEGPPKKGLKKGLKKEVLNALFEDFWEKYPRRNGKRGSKQDALSKYKIIIKTEEDASTLITCRDNYAAECAATDCFPKDACRFLSADRWKDYTAANYEPPTQSTDDATGGLARAGSVGYGD